MKHLQKVLSVFVSLMLCMGMISFVPKSVHAASTDTLIRQMISYYANYGEQGKTDIERLVAEVKMQDEALGKTWENIMNYWYTTNEAGFTKIGVVPENLPNDDSLVIVILGFALTADGEMKPELIGRLQTGLAVAKAYPNAIVAVTGGATATNRPDILEGDLMSAWLIEQGIEEHRIINENQAGDTVGNARNTYKILKNDYPNVNKMVMVTSHYHIPRGSILFYSTFALSAYNDRVKPIEIVANSGYDAGHEGYETMSLTARGVCQVADLSTSFPSVTLSKLEALSVTQEAFYQIGNELSLKVIAHYDSGYQKDVTDLVEISNFDSTLGPQQRITISYEENGITMMGTMRLTQASASFNDYMAKLYAKVETPLEAAFYTQDSYALYECALNYASNLLKQAHVSDEEIAEVYKTLLQTEQGLVKRENIALNKSVLASHNQTNASQITDGDITNYWESSENGSYIPIADASFIIDLENVYTIEAIQAIPYYAGVNRYYHYDILISEDGNEWTTIASQRSIDDTTTEGYLIAFNAIYHARYIKVVGIAMKAEGRDDIKNFHMNEVFVYGSKIIEDDVEGERIISNIAQYAKTTVDSGSNAHVLTDGKIENVYTGSSNGIANAYAMIELPMMATIDEVKVVTYYNKLDKWYTYEVFVSEDGSEWTSVGARVEESNPGKSGYSIKLEEPTPARFVKVEGRKTNNTNLHLVEIEVYGSMDNIALNKAVYVSHVRDRVNEDHSKYQGSNIVDGKLNTYWDSDDIGETIYPEEWGKVTEAEMPYAIIDLGQNYAVDTVDVMAYRGERYYHYQVSTSVDGETYALFGEKNNNDSSYFSVAHHASQETIARYIRIDGRYCSSGGSFHLIEVRASGTPLPEADANYEAVDAAIASIPSDLSNYTLSSIMEVKKAELNVIRGLKASRQAEVDAMAQAILAAIDALVKKISTMVENLVANVVDYKTIQLTWDVYPNTQAYIIERFTAEGEWIVVAETTEPAYIATGVKTGKSYIYRVKADNSEYSEEISATPMLSGEVELSIVMNDPNKFDLSWTTVEGATRYIIYRKDGQGEWKKISTLGKDATTYTSKEMKPNTYQYQVKAARYDASERVMTNGSNVVEGNINADNMMITNVNAKIEDGSVIISFDKVAGMPYYEIYRSKDGGAYRHLKTITTTTITTASLKTGSSYTYQIRAYTIINGVKVYTPFVTVDITI